MKLLGIAFFILAALCACAVGDDVVPTSNITTSVSALTSKSATEAVNPSTPQATTPQASVLATTAIRATDEPITNKSTAPSINPTQQITQGTTTRPPVKATTTAASKNDSTTTTTQASTTQLAQNVSLGASSTKAWSVSSTSSLQKTTSAPGTSGLRVSSPTEPMTLGSPASNSGNKNVPENAIHYSSVILPIVITLIVITLAAFSLVALYRMCQKKTPERQENGTEQAQSDKEGVKLLSVKTTSAETGEHPSQGKNKTRQLFTPQQ
ncbi:endomucin isoform X1 [Patagioenas fasciata]|uniref:endomucin isoform X1 n=1 Tax=Patagioenas fasciata TaxID=372321 RepID=UPI003A99F748